MLTVHTNPPNRLRGISSTKRRLESSLPAIDGSSLLTRRRSYVVGLENRIVTLEAKTEKLSKLAVAGLATSNSPYLNKSPTSVGASSAHSEETWLAEDQPQEPQREEDATDVVAISFLSDQDSGFFGGLPRPE